MKVTKDKIENCQAYLTVEMEDAEMAAGLADAYKRLAQKASIPGFRKGKAPRQLVEQYLGKAAILEEAVDRMLPQAYEQALTEQELEPFAQPSVEITQMEPLAFKATVPLAEYGLLYITMLGSPWLLRTKGEIIVESFRMVMPPRVRRVVEFLVYVVCAALCAILAWYALTQGIDSWHTGDGEQRAILVPNYYAYAPMFVGFGLMFIEFLRLLFGRESLYEQSATERESI